MPISGTTTIPLGAVLIDSAVRPSAFLLVKSIAALFGILVLSACTHHSVTSASRMPRVVPQLAKRVDPSEERRDNPGRTPSPHLTLDSVRALAAVPALLSLGEWRPVGPWIYAGKAFDVAVSPVDPNTVYAAFGVGGGLWKTSDGGQTWLQLTDRSDLTDIGCVSVHPSIPDVVVACIGGPLPTTRKGLMYSTDAGRHFDFIGPNDSLSASFYRAIFSPTDPNIIYTASAQGIYLTTNRGTTWSTILTFPGSNSDSYDYYPDLVMKPDNPSVLIAAQLNLGVFRTADGGVTWNRIDQAMDPTTQTSILAWSPSDPNTVYCERNNTDGQHMMTYVSKDAGVTWSRAANLTFYHQDRYDMALTVDPTNSSRVVLANGYLGISPDGLKTYNGYNGYPHVDHLRVAFSPSNPSMVYDANDGGIWRSTDAGATWSRMDIGVNTNLSFGFDIDPVSGQIYLSPGDYSSFQYTPTAGWYVSPRGGEWSKFYIDPNNSATVWHAAAPGGSDLAVSHDRGQTWTAVDPEPSAPRPYRTVVRFSPTQAGTMFFLTNKIWVSHDAGTTWTDLGVRSTNPQFSDMIADSVQPGTFYVSENGGILTSHDGGATWTEHLMPQPWYNVMAPVPGKAGTFYLGNTYGGLYLFSNGGQSAQTLGGALFQSLTVNDLATDPAHPERVYAGTAAGLFFSQDYGQTWQRLGRNLPVTNVWQISIKGTTIYAGTSQGIWQFNSNVSWQPASPALTVTATSTTSISLSWKPGTSSTGVRIFRNGVQGYVGLESNYTDLSLTPATNYCYTVLDSVASGEGPLSSPLCVNTAAGGLPSLAVSATSLQFAYTKGVNLPGGQPVQIANGAGGALSWTAASSVPWLTLSSASGSAPGVLGIEVNPAAEVLTLGTYTGTVSIAAPGIASQSISVTLTVSPSPPPPVVVSDFGPNSSFSSTNGWCVSGANTLNCGPAVTRYIAAPFIPNSTFTVSSIALPVGTISGTNGAVVNLMSTAGGLPGPILESWSVSNLPSGPVVTTVSSKLAPVLQAGQTYWLEVQPLAADTMAFWYTNNLGLAGGITNINQAGWIPLSGYAGQTLPAFSVVGSSSQASARANSGVYRNGAWYVDWNGNNQWDATDAAHVVNFGLPGDQAVAGDWTGNGQTRLGVFRNGVWYLDLNNNGQWDGVAGGDGIFAFGLPGDVAVVGDWNGDGRTKLGVFRCPQSGGGGCTWVLDMAGKFAYDPATAKAFSYGLPGDTPVVNNWNGTSNVDQIGVYRPMPNGLGLWIVDSNGSGGWDASDAMYWYGLAQDIPVVGNWNSGARKRIGVFRNGVWILDTNGNNAYDATDGVGSFGLPGDQPVVGNWSVQ